MVNLSVEKIRLIYEIEQLRLEEALIDDFSHGGFRHALGNFDSGVFCVIEIVEENPIKVDLLFQGRKCDFEVFAKRLRFDIGNHDFKIKPAPEHKAPSICSFNKCPSPANMQIFENKTPIDASLSPIAIERPIIKGSNIWGSKIGDIGFIPITKHVVDSKPSLPFAYPVCGHRPDLGRLYTFMNADVALEMTIEEIKGSVSFFESSVQDRLESLTLQFEQTSISTTERDLLTRPKQYNRRSAQKSNSLRSSIKKTIAQESLKKEDSNVSEPTTNSNGNRCTTTHKTDQRGKSTKHQGKAKTFKRKSKRPGRI